MYTHRKTTPLGYQEAISRVKDALKGEGFGILTEIDVKSTLKSKLNVDFDDYVILGACNPQLAYRALAEEQDIGVLLPCNVIVYRKGGETYVACVLPSVQLGKVGNPALMPIAAQVEEKLRRAIDSV